MADNDKLALFKEQHSQIKPRFEPAWEKRQRWESYVFRESPVELHPALKAYGDKVDIQSPDLEWQLHSIISYLTMNETRIDAPSLDDKATAKKIAEKIRIYLASSYLKQNRGRKLDRYRAEMLALYGVAIVRKRWQMPMEPDDEALSKYMKAKSDAKGDVLDQAYAVADNAEARLEARDRYFENDAEHPFDWKPVNPLQCCWFPLEDPDIFFQEAEVPYLEWKRMKNRQGKGMTLDEMGKKLIIGDPEPVDTEQKAQDTMKSVHIVIRAMRKPGSDQWTMTEVVYPDGGSLDDAEEFNEYDVPFGRCPYFITASGHQLLSQTDPDKRYRPFLYPLLVDVAELNVLVTTLVALALAKAHDEGRMYIKIGANATPEFLSWLTQHGTVEGQGAETTWVVDRPRPNTGELAMSPEVASYPNEIEPHMFLRIQQVQENIQRHMVSPLLTGTYEKIAEATATSVLNQMQAAALPFGPYLTEIDKNTEDFLNAEATAICYWDKGSPEGTAKKYSVRTTGDEPVLTSPTDPGQVITLTAEEVERAAYFVLARTKNTTKAEQEQEYAAADLAYERGRITKEQWFRRTDIADPQKQMEELERDRLDRMFEQEFAPLQMNAIKVALSAETGMNFPAMLPPMGGTPGAGGGMPAGAPPQQGATGPIAKPQMTPAPVEGAEGATTGMAGAMQ